MAEKYSPVLPSSLLEQAGDEFDGFKSTYNNFSLKTGIILKSYDIDDVNNISKNFVEYDVIAIESQGNLATGPVIFKKCPSLEGFGGVANFYEAKLKASSNDKVKYDGEIAKSDGSVVLLLCINGNEDSAMIIGSSKHPARKTTLTKEAGQHLEGEYNGVNWQVNKDGELTITFKSPSSIDNQKVKYKDEKAKGTYLKIDKTGSIDINDGATENIKIDKTNKTIGIKADKDVSVSTNGSFKVTAKENIQMKSTKDLLLEAEGKADIIIKKDMSFEISKNLKGKAGQIELESDSITKIKTKQLMVQGDMVQIQASQVQLQASMIMLGNGGTPAVTMMTKFLGIGFAGTPVVSSAIGPMSSSVFIA